VPALFIMPTKSNKSPGKTILPRLINPFDFPRVETRSLRSGLILSGTRIFRALKGAVCAPPNVSNKLNRVSWEELYLSARKQLPLGLSQLPNDT